MLKVLKRRFIILAVSLMTLTLTIAFSAVNIGVRAAITSNTDELIELLYESGGRFSIFKHSDSVFKNERNNNIMRPETPFETRYYVVYIDQNNTIYQADYSHIALSNLEAINSQIVSIALGGKQRGYYDNYRYGVYETDDGQMIIGIDCSKDLSTANTLTMITFITIISCIIIVMILLIIFSGRVLKPFEENREKQRRFITDAGHELKTPIAIIRSNTEVMEMIDGESKWLKNIKQQTDRMGKLVKDLIELSKMDEQTLSEKEKQRLILSEIVFNSAESFRVVAESKGITLTTDIKPDVAVMGDLEDIVRVIGILIDNAVKYTDDRKKIEVALKTKGKKAILTVSNTCSGLNREEIDKFFDRFYRSDESRSSEKAGYGIGLSMAQMIVQNHKGKISASYSEDEVIIFTVEMGQV